jgi:drug/metabolite transporter (DMT)-like permease
MKCKNSYHLYAAVTIFFWALGYVFTRLALRYFPPFPLGFLRYFAASCFLAAVVLTKKIRLPAKSDAGWLILSGAVGFFLYMLAFNSGSRTVTSATSCTVLAVVPVLTALLARAFYREKLTALQWTSIGVSFAGVVVLTALEGGLSANFGLVYIFAAAVLLSVYNLLQRRLTKTCSPLQSTAFSIFSGTIMLGIFAPAAAAKAIAAPPIQLGYVLVLGVFCGAVAYCSWTKALSLAKNTSSVSNYMFVEPFLAALFGYLFARERISLSTAAGGTIILTGLFLFYFGNRLTERFTGRAHGKRGRI